MSYKILTKTIYAILEECENFDDWSKENATRIDYLGFTDTLEEAEKIVESIKKKSLYRKVWITEITKIKYYD